MAIRDQQQHEMGGRSKTASDQNARTSQDDGQEDEEVSNRSSPSGRVLYKAVLKEADEELSRPSSALFWSGLAAGLSMGFSMIAEGLMRHYLPRAQWTPLVSRLGYSVGFIVVIL